MMWHMATCQNQLLHFLMESFEQYIAKIGFIDVIYHKHLGSYHLFTSKTNTEKYSAQT
jgi:hypothetical protein